jgi:hypothetical protein
MKKSDARRELLRLGKVVTDHEKERRVDLTEKKEQRKRNGFVKDYDTCTSYNYRHGDETDTDLLRLTRMVSRGNDGGA